MGLGILRRRVVGAFLHFRFGRVLGLGLFVAALCRYRSYENTPVLGLWSYPFFLVIAVASSLLLVLLVLLLRASARTDRDYGLSRFSAMIYIDLAVLFWGIAYFLSACDAPASAGRVTDLNFFGSVMPAAALLEFIALALLFLGVCGFAIGRLRGRWAKAGLAVGTISFIVLVGEGIARIRVAVAPVTEGFPTYSSEVWTRRYVKLNHGGWRDTEHTVLRDTSTHRLLIVGDSFAFGWGIPRVEDRLGEQLRGRLERRRGAHWELLSASRGDSNTLDEIEFMQRMAVYKPDVVLLIYVFNDIDYLFPVTPRDSPSDQPYWARFYPQWLLYRNSYLFQEVFVRLRLISYRIRQDQRPDPYRDASLVSRHLADVARFVAIAAQSGATVQVVPFDVTIVRDPKSRRRYQEFTHQAVIDGIPICSLEKTFDGLAYGDLTVNALDGHPNETANRLAAVAVCDCVTTKLAR